MSVEGHRVEGPRHGLRELVEQATPGPWVTDDRVRNAVYVKATGQGVASAWTTGAWQDRAIANRDLIALAPELARGYADALDALREIRRQNPAGTAARAVQAANAALASAARLFPEDAA